MSGPFGEARTGPRATVSVRYVHMPHGPCVGGGGALVNTAGGIHASRTRGGTRGPGHH
jgi:hypothetical protein